MSGRSKRRPGDSPVVDVADVFADDALIDALVAERAGVESTPGTDVGSGVGVDPLLELFDSWRDEISANPMPPVPAIRQTSQQVTGGRHHRARTVRPALLIAAAICALLIGSAAVGSRTARPGDTLWGLASVLWTDRTESIHSLDEVKIALAQVHAALEAGRPEVAREALMRATVQLGHVDDLDMPASMPATLQKLWVDVVPDAQRRTAQTSASLAAAGAEPSTPSRHPSPSAAAAGTPVVSTPLIGTILEALIASAQPSVSADSSTPTSSTSPGSSGSSVPATTIALPPVVDPSTSAVVTDPSTDPPTDATTVPTSPVSTDPPTDPPTDPAVPVTPPDPSPASTEPPVETSPSVPVEPTVESTPSESQTATENSPPAPPPPSTEPTTATTTATTVTTVTSDGTSADTSAPAVTDSDPATIPG